MPDFSMPCPHCNSMIENIPEEQAGQIITCMECGKTVQALNPSDAVEVKKPAGDDIVLGDKVSDSDMEGFESFETPEEEEVIEEAELIRIRVPWRTSKFMGIVCDLLFLVAACELAFCAYLIYQAQIHKTDELPAKFAQERKEKQAARKTAQDKLVRTRKNIRDQILADEKEEAVFHKKTLLAAMEKVPQTNIKFPEKIDPAKKPFLEKNPFASYLDALKTCTLVDEDTRRSAVLELTQHLKNILDEIKEQRKYDRVAVVEEVIEPFMKSGIDLSEVSVAAKAVIQFEKDEKIRLEQEAKDKVRREKERIAALERRRQEALEKIANYKEQLVAAAQQLYACESKFDFISLRPHEAQTLFYRICLEKSRNANGTVVSVDTLLKHVAKVSNIKLSRDAAVKICTARFDAIDKGLPAKFSVAAERAAAEKRAVELYPEIKRGQQVQVLYKGGNYRGAYVRADQDGVIVNGRKFAWERLEDECRKRLDPEVRKNVRAAYVKKRLEQLQSRQEQERARLRTVALRELFRAGVVMSGVDATSTAAFIQEIYPSVRELNDVRRELERILTVMYPVFRSPSKPAAKMFVSGLHAEFGLKEHSNMGKALQFYGRAVKLKSLEAMLRLGDIYSAPRNTVRGVEPNLQGALAYYRMAEKMNNEYAKTRVKELTAQLTRGKNAKDAKNAKNAPDNKKKK